MCVCVCMCVQKKGQILVIISPWRIEKFIQHLVL